ncbi:hypothetical protein BGZ99_004626 [Dissophora globulifera]|uniref:Dienelactone hydrolase domain-containing protein n=1 Tax=Dissophora globulifera TaxID=979702 RepID=A0A9P6UUI6_9FUNG|nr:hypothetical protein BGZ99_004626 [Dissophora globulifera]
MTLVDACCNTLPTDAEWQPKGADTILGTKIDGHERKIYRTGPKDSKRGIIAITDPLGFHPTTIQVYDRIAESHGGFQLAAPHVMKDGPLPLSMLGDRPAMMEWMMKNYNYKECHFDQMILAAVRDLQADGCTTFSIFGQCMGAFIAIRAASEPGQPFLATGGPHPSMTTVELVQDVKCPVILLPSKDEADMIPIIEAVNKKNFAVESFQKRYDNAPHGWCGGRGDWSDPEIFKAGLEAVDLLGGYFAKVAEIAEKDQ